MYFMVAWGLTLLANITSLLQHTRDLRLVYQIWIENMKCYIIGANVYKKNLVSYRGCATACT